MYQQITANKRRTTILIGTFILLILALGWLIGETTDYGPGMIVFAATFSLIMTLTSYFHGDKIALWTAGARPGWRKRRSTC